MYLIIGKDEAIVIDPCRDDEALELLKQHSIKKVNIILTHEHYDHTSGVIWFGTHFQCNIICNKECAGLVAKKKTNNPAYVALLLADQDKKDGGNRYA
jgi:glyoxylase-like metal-dependent hydrolase (beta-lactamase superfamily II)